MAETGTTNRWIAFVVTLAAAAWLGWAAAQPPVPLARSAPPEIFSAERAMDDVQAIARAPHPTGSAENARVRAYLVRRLQALGFSTREVRVPLSAKARERLIKWGGKGADRANGINIVAVHAGQDMNSRLIMLMAHYDTVWASPGAADDSFGVAAALEAVRALGPGTPQRGLLVLFTDAEELGLEGAKAFFASDPLARRVGVLINLESRGGGGRAMMFETGPGNRDAVTLLKNSVRDPSANSLAVKIYELLPNSTDFTPAKRLGVAGYNFAMLGRAELYHSPAAIPSAIDQGALQHIGTQALDLTRALMAAEFLPRREPDAVFSDVLGQFLIAYPPLLGWTLIAAAAALLMIAVNRRGAPGLLVALGVVRGLGFAAAAAGLLWAANLVTKAPGSSNYYDRLAALPRLEVQALLLVLASLLVAVIGGRTPHGFRGTWLGLALLNLSLAAAVQLVMPAAGPLFAWPLLLAMALLALSPGKGPPLALLAVVAAVPALAQLGGFAHFALLAIGGDAPFAVAGLLPMALLLLWPVKPDWTLPPVAIATVPILAAALLMAVWVRYDPMAPTVPPYSDKR